MSSTQARSFAIGLMCLAIALFSIMSALAKSLGSTYSVIQIILFRSAFALIPVAFAIRHVGITNAVRINNLRFIILRTCTGLCAMLTFFYSLKVLPLAEVIALTFSAPLFTAIFGVVFLHEHVGWRRWSAIIIGFVGIIVMLRPGTAVFSLWSLLPLASAMFYSMSVITVRVLGRTETSATIVLYFTLMCICVAAAGAPFAWVSPTPQAWLTLALMGCAGGTVQLCSAAALKRAPVAVLAPFEYTSIVWTTILGFLIWNEWPRPEIWVGGLTVAGAAIYIAYRESRVNAA